MKVGSNVRDFKGASFSEIARAPICENVAFHRSPIQRATSRVPFEKSRAIKAPQFGSKN